MKVNILGFKLSRFIGQANQKIAATLENNTPITALRSLLGLEDLSLERWY